METVQEQENDLFRRTNRCDLIGPVYLGAAEGQTGELNFSNSSNINLTTLKAGVASAGKTYTLPLTAPTVDGQGLVSTTAGVMSWGSALGPVIDASSYASINAAVTAIGSASATLQVSNAQTLAASLTVPSNINLVILKTGSIVKASTFTLTINGPFTAGRWQVFSGFTAGDVTGLNVAFPEWWGTATGDFQSACDSLIVGGVVDIQQAKTYTLTSQITINVNRISIVGLGFESNVNYTPSANNTHAFGTNGTLDNVAFKNFTLHQTNPGTRTGTSGIFFIASDSAVTCDGLTISNFNRFGINPGAGVQYVTIKACRFLQVRDSTSTFLATAIRLDGNNVVRIEDCQFSECDKDIQHNGGSVFLWKGCAHEVGNDVSNTLADETVVLSAVKEFECSNNYFEGNTTASTYAVLDIVNCIAGEVHSNLLNGQDAGNVDKSHRLINVSGASTRDINIHNNAFVETIDYFISSTVGGVTASENYYFDGGAEKTTIATIQALFNNPGNIRLIQTISGTTFDSAILEVDGQLIAKGTATNDSAASGYIGEILSASTVRSAPVALTTTISANVTSKSLTAGDWDVFVEIGFTGGGTTTVLAYALATTSATLPGTDTLAVPTSNQVRGNLPLSVAATDATDMLYCRVSLASTTTVYLVANATFAIGSASAYGSITARRIR